MAADATITIRPQVELPGNLRSMVALRINPLYRNI
jgi:hypothetical protein